MNTILAPRRRSISANTVNADLHCHSVVSDGVLTPTEVAHRAADNGVEIWSLTDHDEIGGQAEAASAAEAFGMTYVPGVEISVTWCNETVHIVGLNVDPDDAGLKDGLYRTRMGRALRAEEIGRLLEVAGIPGAFAGALTYVGNPNLISRTHFARHLVASRVCSTVNEVFSRYLVGGKPGYVPMHWASLADAVGWIRDSGGTAVVAHPGRYKMNDIELDAFLTEFRDVGGTAIEVITGSHTVDQYRKFAVYAKDYGFMASRGSDFHAPAESHIELGKLPPLPDSLLPVWHDWI